MDKASELRAHYPMPESRAAKGAKKITDYKKSGKKPGSAEMCISERERNRGKAKESDQRETEIYLTLDK